MKSKKPIIIGALITLVYFLIHLRLINDYGISWDYHFHLYGGRYLLGLSVPSPDEEPPVPFTPPDPRLTVDDPFGPIMSIVPVISQILFFEKLKILPFDAAYNLPSIIYGSLGIGLLFIFIYQSVGFKEAILSSLFLGLLPNYFGYLHTNMKDIPNAFAFALSIFLFWRLVKYQRPIDLLLAVSAFALAFNIKINAVVIPVVCFVWFWVIRGIRGISPPSPHLRQGYGGQARLWRVKERRVLPYFILAPLAAVALWWSFWKDPLGKLLVLPTYFSNNTINMPNLLFGEIFRSGVNIPWYYPYLYIGITTPLPVLVFFIVGLFVISLNILNTKSEYRLSKQYQNSNVQNSKRPNTYLLLLLWFFVPLARFFVPNVSAIDGVRHFMEVIFPLTAIGGIGAMAIYRRVIIPPSPRLWRVKKIGVIGGIIILFFLIKNIVAFHPYQTSYFNSLIGGIRGAQGKFDIDFWGTPQRNVVFWLNENAATDSNIHIVMAQSSAGVYLREDLLKNLNKKNIWESDYVVVLNRESFFTQELKDFIERKKKEGKVVFSREIDGVPLVWMFAR